MFKEFIVFGRVSIVSRRFMTGKESITFIISEVEADGSVDRRAVTRKRRYVF